MALYNCHFSLSDLDKFIKVVDRGMSTEITDNLGYDELVTVIGYLRVNYT